MSRRRKCSDELSAPRRVRNIPSYTRINALTYLLTRTRTTLCNWQLNLIGIFPAFASIRVSYVLHALLFCSIENLIMSPTISPYSVNSTRSLYNSCHVFCNPSLMHQHTKKDIYPAPFWLLRSRPWHTRACVSRRVRRRPRPRPRPSVYSVYATRMHLGRVATRQL